VSSFLTELQHI